jgi:uncharacterized protein YydD (DUF2326 family)
MRLLKLAANKPTFREVTFNRSGLSFVIGQKESQADTPRNRTKTYNGVGKSLMLELIHFCLGANANDAFKTHLTDWVFYLTVEISDRTHVISRDAGEQSSISLDEEEISLKQLRQWLLDNCFDAADGVKGLSFRSLLLPFIRSGRAAYERFDRADEGDSANPYWPLVRNAFLFGLDLHLAQTKYELRSRQTLLSKTMKQLESDPLFADFLSEDTAGIELNALREEAARLEADLRDFRVADDYAGIQDEANSLKRKLEFARREHVKTVDAIAQIDRSLQTKTDVDPALVRRVYEEAQLAFPEQVQRHIDQVVAFQRELQQRRIFRLTSERQQLERRRDDLERQVEEADAELEKRVRYLGSHIALDEFLAVSDRLNECRQLIARLEASAEQRGKVNRELRTIARDLADQSLKTDDYLSAEKASIEEANGLFRSYTKALYGNRPSGVTVVNDAGENLTRYRIDAHITSDAAEGINEAKIFCYDMMIVALGRRHRIEFLAHDSTLFQPVDPRQRLAMLKRAHVAARDLGIQYIAALNEHDVNSMNPVDADEQAVFRDIFSPKNIVLQLTDRSPRERLLGVEIDMNYRQKASAARVATGTR